MANVKQGNVWLVDSTGSLTTEPRQKVSDIIYTASGAGDNIVLRASASGPDIITIKNPTANSTMHIPLNTPLFFPQGIYVQTLTSGSKAMVILTQGSD